MSSCEGTERMGVKRGHVFGVDAGTVAVFDLALAHLHGPDHRGEIQVQIDARKQIVSVSLLAT